MAWKANGDPDLPLADRERDWDGDAARERVFRWAGWEENPRPEQARRAFFAYDDEKPDHKTAYKLPFADVIDGQLLAVPHGILAVAEVLEDARGGVDLPRDVQESIRPKVAHYYHRMGRKAPWEKEDD